MNHQIFELQVLQNQKIDYVIAFDEINRFWLTNFKTSLGIVVCDLKTKKIVSFLDPRYFQEGKKDQTIEVQKLKHFATFWKKTNGKVAFDQKISFQTKENLQKINQKNIWKVFDFQQFRIIKNEDQIAKIRFICQKTFDVWKKTKTIIDKNKSEIDITKEIIKNFIDRDILKISFFPIVASNKNSAFIHTEAKNQKIINHVLCDFGGKFENYNSDFSRTMFLKKESFLKNEYQQLKKLQQTIIKNIEPGVKISKIVKLYHDFFKQKNWKIEHALGHGIGLEVHEAPSLTITNDQTLEKGMVFTIEPGVYFENIGGLRVEDVVVVTEKGCEILTK